MYCIRPASPSTLSTLRAVKLAVTFLSLLLGGLCLVIIRTTPTLSKQYARLLSVLIITATFFDFYTQCIFDAQLIMPVMCIFRDAPIINVPMSAGAAFVTWIVLVLLNPTVYGACFIHRHQLIVPYDSVFKLRPFALTAFLLLTTVVCTSFGYTYYLAWVPGADLESSLRDEISDDWDKEGISRMDCFITHKTLRNVWGIVLIFYCTIFVGGISLHTSSIIRNASYLSTRTRAFHRTMLRSLLIVGSVPLLFILAPFVIAFAFYKLLGPEIFTSFPMMDACLVVIALHSTVHSLTLILTTPMFRNRIRTRFYSRASVSIIPLSPTSQFTKV